VSLALSGGFVCVFVAIVISPLPLGNVLHMHMHRTSRFFVFVVGREGGREGEPRGSLQLQAAGKQNGVVQCGGFRVGDGLHRGVSRTEQDDGLFSRNAADTTVSISNAAETFALRREADSVRIFVGSVEGGEAHVSLAMGGLPYKPMLEQIGWQVCSRLAVEFCWTFITGIRLIFDAISFVCRALSDKYCTVWLSLFVCICSSVRLFVVDRWSCGGRGCCTRHILYESERRHA